MTKSIAPASPWARPPTPWTHWARVTDEQPVPALDRAAVEGRTRPVSRSPSTRCRPSSPRSNGTAKACTAKARRGESVTLEARPVVIHELTLVDWMPPRAWRSGCVARPAPTCAAWPATWAPALGYRRPPGRAAAGSRRSLHPGRRPRSPPLKRPRRAGHCRNAPAHGRTSGFAGAAPGCGDGNACRPRAAGGAGQCAQRDNGRRSERGPQAAWPRPKTTTATSWASCAACTGKMRAGGCGRPRSGWPEPARGRSDDFSRAFTRE